MSEALGGMLVLLFGPKKPFAEAEARTTHMRLCAMASVAALSVGQFFIQDFIQGASRFTRDRCIKFSPFSQDFQTTTRNADYSLDRRATGSFEADCPVILH